MKIAIAITGASGAIYARRLLKRLSRLSAQVSEIALVLSTNAATVWQEELQDDMAQVIAADARVKVWANHDFYAPIASGSAQFHAMVICPCSMGTMGRIAQGISNDLITRAADVMLKERRKLICVVREAPYNLIHLRNMTSLTEAGAIICPASPSFYSKPQTIEELADTIVERVVQLCGLQQNSYEWGNKATRK